LSQRGRRVTGVVSAVLLFGSAMTGIVFADNNHWLGALVAWGLLGVLLYFLGTAAYRVSLRTDGRIEAHSLLGLRKLDLREGFGVKRGLGVFVVRARGKRYRVNPGLGPAPRIEQWMQEAQLGSTISGNG
jgi:hypothetical protein